MTYRLSWQGVGYGVAPDDPYDELCPACGYELHACQCPVDVDYDEWDADFQARIDAGEIAVPEEGDAVFAAGFERLVNP